MILELTNKSNTMKSKATQPNFYFSAYPLKVLNVPESEKKSYLHIYRNKDGEVKKTGRLKVLPIKNPYKDSYFMKNETSKEKPQDSIEQRDSEWFASYE